MRAGELDHAPGIALADHAFEAGVIDAEEHKRLFEAGEAREEVIRVDAFDPKEYGRLRR